MTGARTIVALALIAGALLAFILVFERDTITSRELAGREGRVLPHFIRKRVREIEITRGDERVVLYREPDPETDGERGIWRVKVPMQAEADEDAVDVLLGELEWMDARRRLESISESDRKRFGLQEPVTVLRYEVGSTTGYLRVGAASPMSDGHYVQADDATVAHVVGKDLHEALDQPPEHYHTKQLHDGVMLLTANRLEIEHDGKRHVVEKRGERFWLTEPVEAWASRPDLETLCDTLDGLEAKRYVAAGVGDGSAFGLHKPRFLASITAKTMVEGKEGEDKRFEDRTMKFRLGAACGEHEGESYVVVGEDGPVMCVADEEFATALETVDQLRERRLLPLEDADVAAVEVGEGEAKLRVTRGGGDGDEAWKYAIEGGTTAHKAGVAQRDTVSAWFTFLRAAEAIDFDQGAADGPLGAPDVSARFEGVQDDEVYRLAVYDDGARLLVRRGDEPQLTAFPMDILSSLRASASPFRNRRLLSFSDASVRELRVTRGAATEVVVRDRAGAFRVQSPVEVPADSVITQELARLLSNLEALQFITDQPVEQHALRQPRIRVELTIAQGEEEPASHELRIGADAVGGSYAQLDDDPTVFVVPASLVAKIEAPLASRTNPAVPWAEIAAIRIEFGESSCEIMREAETFAFRGQEPSSAAVDIAEGLAGLRARSVAAYGADPHEADLTARVTVARLDGGHTELAFGGVNDAGLVPVARAGVPVWYLLEAGDAHAVSRCPPVTDESLQE